MSKNFHYAEFWGANTELFTDRDTKTGHYDFHMKIRKMLFDNLWVRRILIIFSRLKVDFRCKKKFCRQHFFAFISVFKIFFANAKKNHYDLLSLMVCIEMDFNLAFQINVFKILDKVF